MPFQHRSVTKTHKRLVISPRIQQSLDICRSQAVATSREFCRRRIINIFPDDQYSATIWLFGHVHVPVYRAERSPYDHHCCFGSAAAQPVLLHTTALVCALMCSPTSSTQRCGALSTCAACILTCGVTARQRQQHRTLIETYI